MSDTAVLLDEIQTLPPSLTAEVLDFVRYLKHKYRKETPEGGAAAPGAGKPAPLPRFTRAQVEAAANSPEIQALVGALKGYDLPPDITMEDEVTLRPAEEDGQTVHTNQKIMQKFLKAAESGDAREHLKKKLAEGAQFDFDAEKLIGGTMDKDDWQNLYTLQKQAWPQAIEKAGI